MVRRIVFASILVLGVAPIIGAQPHRALQPAAFASAPGVVTASARRLARESPDPSEEATDVHDLLRRLRHKPPVPAEVKDDDPEYARPVWLRVPFISSSPANGVVVGAGLDVSFFRSPPAVTRASSFESSLAVSTRKQVLSSTRYSVYGRNDTWRLSGENRFDQTSIDLHPLGSGTLTADAVEVDYRSVRSFNTIYHRVYRDIYAGVGLRITSRSSIEPKPGGAAAWPSSDFMSYSRDMGLPTRLQASTGFTADAVFDSRDSSVYATHGVLLNASYRVNVDGAIGGSSRWQELYAEARGYRAIRRWPSQTLAVRGYVDVVTSGTAPYFDLPATGGDPQGRSGRGYILGRFRGDGLLYAEAEYRAALTHDGLIGVVAFVNVTTVKSDWRHERFFEVIAPAAGAGVRVLMDKLSRSSLCLDVGFGRAGSYGVYLGIQEAF